MPNAPADTAERNRRRVTSREAASGFEPTSRLRLLQVFEQVTAFLRGKSVEKFLGHERGRQLAKRIDAVAGDAGLLALRVDERDARAVLLGDDASNNDLGGCAERVLDVLRPHDGARI